MTCNISLRALCATCLPTIPTTKEKQGRCVLSYLKIIFPSVRRSFQTTKSMPMIIKRSWKEEDGTGSDTSSRIHTCDTRIIHASAAQRLAALIQDNFAENKGTEKRNYQVADTASQQSPACTTRTYTHETHTHAVT
jgi:hypothetical protein